VNDTVVDDGLTARELRTTAWVLGLVAVGALVRLCMYAANDVRAQAELFVWALIGAMAAVFSASCAVLAGLKSVELRLSRHVDRSGR
jgi:hypothetical protein